jgi:peptidyl-lysine (3S)-dioxygenase / protease
VLNKLVQKPFGLVYRHVLLCPLALLQDHYENMYCVVRGEKHFTLLPPSDIVFLHQQQHTAARYSYDAAAQQWSIEVEEDTVPWIPVDPALSDQAQFPLFKYASPLQCTVRAGEILYLPAMW